MADNHARRKDPATQDQGLDVELRNAPACQLDTASATREGPVGVATRRLQVSRVDDNLADADSPRKLI